MLMLLPWSVLFWLLNCVTCCADACCTGAEMLGIEYLAELIPAADMPQALG